MEDKRINKMVNILYINLLTLMILVLVVINTSNRVVKLEKYKDSEERILEEKRLDSEKEALERQNLELKKEKLRRDFCREDGTSKMFLINCKQKLGGN